MVSQGETVPQQVAVLVGISFSVAVLIDHVLDGVYLTATVVRVYDDYAPLVALRWAHHCHFVHALLCLFLWFLGLLIFGLLLGCADFSDVGKIYFFLLRILLGKVLEVLCGYR